MSKIEESVKNVIDELLDHDENFQYSDSCPTRCEDSVQVLDGCSKILNGSYRNDEIAQKIKDIGFSFSSVKKLLTVLLTFLMLLIISSGCSDNSSKITDNSDDQIALLALRYHEEEKYSEAAPLLEKLAQKNDAPSQYMLAMYYRAGLGVPKNQKKEIEWMKRAAYGGVKYAQKMMGGYYLDIDLELARKGVDEDNTERKELRKNYIEWFRKAARQGEEDAIKTLEVFGENY